MSNLSQKMGDSDDLEYSISSFNSSHQVNHQRLTDSLQYLDRVRSINKKVFEADSSRSLISPLEKLINCNKEITFVDNEGLYGIIKVQSFTKLKARLKELEILQQKNKQNEHELRTQNDCLSNQLTLFKSRQLKLNRALQQLQYAIQQQKKFRQLAEEDSKSKSDLLITLTNQRIEDSKRYLALKTDFNLFKSKIQGHQSIASAHLMISETQTSFQKPTIEISPFEPNLEEILRKLRQKQGEKISRPTLKEIVSQSLDAFVKELDSQYKLIHQQTIELTGLREKNHVLVQENIYLKNKLEETKIEEEKLKIFRECMTDFLSQTTQNVTKSLEAQTIKKTVNEDLNQRDRYAIQSLLQSSQQQSMKVGEQNIESQELRQMRQNLEYLKRQNFQLLKSIGEYQYKWKNVEKVLDESRKEEIPDDGTVGQLVKMSKMVKESIKSLLYQL